MSVDDAAVGTDDVDGAAYNAPADAIRFGHFPALIDQEGEGEFVFGGKLAVGIGSLPIDAVDGGVEAFEGGPIVADFAELFRANGGVVTGIEDQDDGFPL